MTSVSAVLYDVYLNLCVKSSCPVFSDAVEFLSGEGHIYSTIDEEHYRSTDAIWTVKCQWMSLHYNISGLLQNVNARRMCVKKQIISEMEITCLNCRGGVIILKLYYDLNWPNLEIFCSRHLLGCYCNPDYVWYLVWFIIYANLS